MKTHKLQKLESSSPFSLLVPAVHHLLGGRSALASVVAPGPFKVDGRLKFPRRNTLRRRRFCVVMVVDLRLKFVRFRGADEKVSGLGDGFVIRGVSKLSDGECDGSREVLFMVPVLNGGGRDLARAVESRRLEKHLRGRRLR
ncbi:Uncharacterized protein Rs2_36982 [Raphanus sativus]|nr:Uncharacterized protein Rs2_36982 [Raphanus sativus]